MNHLTDETVNEYLDNELLDRAEVEQHLSQCADCAARLATLQTLFTEIESLPELAISRSLREASQRDAAPFTRRDAGFAFPRWLKLTAILQAAVAIASLMIAAPLITERVPTIQTPSLTDLLLQLQSQWAAWPDMFSTFQIPPLPQLPVLEISSLVLTLTLAGVSVLWLVGNGLLLRNKIK